MNKAAILALTVSAVLSTSALANRIPYAVLQLPSSITCHSNVPGTCAGVSVNPGFYAGSGISYYDTTANELVIDTAMVSMNFHFANNKAKIVTCSSNPASGNGQPEPLAYCQNPKNYYQLDTMTMHYHPATHYISSTSSSYQTFDNNGSIGWVSYAMSGMVLSPNYAI